MSKIIKKIFIVMGIGMLLLLIFALIYANFNIAPYVTNIEVSDSKNFEDEKIFNVEVGNYFFKFDKDTWCLITDKKELDINSPDWIKAQAGYCSFSVKAGDYNVFVKDKYDNVNSLDTQSVKINKIVDIKMNKDTIYMYEGRIERLSYELVKLGEVKNNVVWRSQDEEIATVSEDGKVTGKKVGITYIEAVANNNIVGKTRVIVSNFITKPKINFNKPYIKCGQFSKDEADLIDQMLFDRVDEAGYGTRAGVIAAARFLTLEFNFRVHYFFENGRLENYYPYAHVDGEGRYYHRGLYLHESKFNEISAIFMGPATWGCNLKNFTTQSGWVAGKKYPNGLDCSGFVSWVLLNGGFDVGDIGAGANADHDDLDDLGKKVYITNDLIKSGKVKVGDLIGLSGHMAIIIGIDDNNYYIAESLDTTKGVVVTTVAKNKLTSSIYKYIMLMDSVYKSNGNYSDMW